MARRRLVMQPLAAGRQVAPVLATVTVTGTVTAGMLHQGVDLGGEQSYGKGWNVPMKNAAAKLAKVQGTCLGWVWLH